MAAVVNKPNSFQPQTDLGPRSKTALFSALDEFFRVRLQQNDLKTAREAFSQELPDIQNKKFDTGYIKQLVQKAIDKPYKRLAGGLAQRPNLQQEAGDQQVIGSGLAIRLKKQANT